MFYDFLPGSGAPYTWKNVANENGVGSFWRTDLSKRPAITSLLEQTLEKKRTQFCGVVLSAVRGGLRYRQAKKTPLTREEIEQVNSHLLKLSFKIPELHDPSFLAQLRSTTAAKPEPTKPPVRAEAKPVRIDMVSFQRRFTALVAEKDTQKRGYEFEGFLNDFFAAHGLAPRSSFRVTGEQIDGTFELNGDTYVVEARWRALPANAADLYVLRAKAEKSEWTRGLFISIGDFTDVASDAFRSGRRTNLITLSGQDLILVLDERWGFLDALRAKLRHAGETGEVYYPLARA